MMFKRGDGMQRDEGHHRFAALARALAQEAPTLLLDEPTSALDIGRQQQVLDLVQELRDPGVAAK